MYNGITPILLLIFNRPTKTQQVFDQIKKAKPKQLFVAADGPRNSVAGEAKQCEDTRKVIEQVDWECKVMKLYREHNLGCCQAVSSAISWFFEQVDEGIILEDDCLPDQTFFWFCQEMLTRYRNNRQVMHVGGSNFQPGGTVGAGDYYFSKLPHVWGWATWRSAWQLYDVNIARFPAFEAQSIIENVFPGKPELQKRFSGEFSRIYNGDWDNWDPQWIFSLFANNGLAIIPNQNLISNVGFGEGATEFGDQEHAAINLPRRPLRSLKPPDFEVPHYKADVYTLEKVFGKQPLLQRALRKLKPR